MILQDLQENKFSKLRRALTDVFDHDFNFELPRTKLEKIQEATKGRIQSLREKGADASHKDFQKLLLISEGLKHVIAEAPVEEAKVGTPGSLDKVEAQIKKLEDMAKKAKDDGDPQKANQIQSSDEMTELLRKKNKLKKNESVEEEIIEEASDLDQAEVLLAAKQMADDLQKMAEDLASMQVEDLMSITNAMKEEVGMAEADAFEAAAEAAIGSALEAVKSANEQVNNAVLTAQGQAPAPTDMDMGPDPEAPSDMDVDLDQAMGDEFQGADAEDEMNADDGEREMKEEAEDPYLAAIKKVKEAKEAGNINKDVVKKAYEASCGMSKPKMKKKK